MAKNRVHLVEEVDDLSKKGKKHFDEVHAAKEGQRIVEANLTNIERCIKWDQEDFQAERDKWTAERDDLVTVREEVMLAKLATETKTVEALNKLLSSWLAYLRRKNLCALRRIGSPPGGNQRTTRCSPMRLAQNPIKWGRTTLWIG